MANKSTKTTKAKTRKPVNRPAKVGGAGILGDPDLDEELKNTSTVDTLGGDAMRWAMYLLAVVGFIAIFILGWSWLSGDDEPATEQNNTTQPTEQTDDDQDSEDTTQAEDETVPQPTGDEQAKEFIKFSEVSGDEFEITGRVTSAYDDRAFDGNAGVIVEGEYRVATEYGGGAADSTVGSADDVGVGDWVEVFATGRKSFSNEVSYQLDIFGSQYFVKGIENPVTGMEVVGDQTSSDDNEEDTEEDSDTGSTTTATGSDDVSIRRAAIAAGNKLTLELEYSGCADHDFGINRVSIDSDESSRKVVLQVVYDANGDTCERLNKSSEEFDISEHLKEFEGKIPYDIEIRGSLESNVIDFTVS